MAPHKEQIEIGRGYKEKYGFHVEEKSVFKSKRGLDHGVIDQISDHKNEPDWMREFRHKALDIFLAKPMPTWGGDLTHMNFDEIYYYLKPAEHKGDTWEDVPEEIKRTFDKLGIPESEQKFLAGSGAQYESESVYHKLKDEWESRGVIFSDTDSALREHEDILKKYFATIVPPNDNKFAALNSAVWSGGSFLYVPPGVKVDLPLQAYFRINAKNVGQFERTLLICDEGAQAHYVEGCFTKGTKIWANPSYKNIEDIQKGERVLTHTGDYKTVYHVQERKYTGDLYTIEYGDRKLEVTAEHPFIVVPQGKANQSEQNWKWEWKAVKSLQAGDYLATPLASKANFKQEALSYMDENFVYLPVKKITKRQVQKLEVYNFGVQGDESYVAGGVAVHNCTAPSYSTDSLHAAVVEVVVKQGGRFRYTTIQNWSSNVYNLVTKRAQAFKDSTMEWVDANLGSKLTMKYPSIYLMEPGARGDILSVACAGKNQHQDAGGKVVHVAPHTSSHVLSKSVSQNGGRSSYRGLVKVYPKCEDVKVNVCCDALIMDKDSRSDTYPYMEIDEKNVNIGHEATVSKIGDEQLFYLRSRGLSEEQANSMIVSGFIEPIVKELPMEYAVEMNRLIQLQMEGSVG